MEKVYIAGPYTGSTPEEVEENVRRAEAASWLYHYYGCAVHCPHSQTHRIHMRYNQNESVGYMQWLQADIAWIVACDKIVFLPGWTSSKGAVIEHTVAKALNKGIVYLTESNIEAAECVGK